MVHVTSRAHRRREHASERRADRTVGRDGVRSAGDDQRRGGGERSGRINRGRAVLRGIDADRERFEPSVRRNVAGRAPRNVFFDGEGHRQLWRRRDVDAGRRHREREFRSRGAAAAPAAGSTHFAPATIALAATASDADGIARVDFYLGATLLGTAISAPYSMVWDNVSAGSYTLTAVATDRLGASATSAPVSITVAGAITISVAPGIDGSTSPTTSCC